MLTDKEKETVIRGLVAALIDTDALLQHYVEGRRDNWDGSTKSQAKATIRSNAVIVEFVRSNYPKE